jgi:ABC-type glycerol-3-phosphate transport system permease component
VSAWGLTIKPRTATVTLRYVTAIALGLVVVFPLVYLMALSVMSPQDAVASPPHLIPPSVHWDNFSKALDYLSARTIVNSFIFTLGVLILQMSLALPAGFAMAQIPFRAAAFVTGLFVVPMFLPSNISIIPLFVVTLKLHLVDTYAGLILPIVGSTAFGTLLFRQFFATLPPGLIDAARLDGAGWWRTLRSIGIPLARPAIAAYSVITFLTAWNMYIWPQIVGTSDDLKVVPVALAPLARSTYNIIPPSVGAAAAVVSALPVIAVFLLGQRWFINGVAGTGLE